MKYTAILLLLLAACAPRPFYLTEKQVQNDTIIHHAPMPQLSAYKYQRMDPKDSVQVKPHTRSNGTQVKGYTRRAPRNSQ